MIFRYLKNEGVGMEHFAQEGQVNSFLLKKEEEEIKQTNKKVCRNKAQKNPLIYDISL